MSKLQEYDYTGATAIALVMLIFAFAILLVGNLIQTHNSKILKGD
jgi:sulfate transport system permease protein